MVKRMESISTAPQRLGEGGKEYEGLALCVAEDKGVREAAQERRGELRVGPVPAREGPPALAQSADDGDVVAGLARVDEVVLSPAVHS